MVVLGGKKVGQVVAGIGGNGLGQILAAVATALLFRLFSGPGPALPPEADQEDRDDFAGDSESGESTADGKVLPVIIRWRNITCSLSDKSSKSVSSFFSLNSKFNFLWKSIAAFKILDQNSLIIIANLNLLLLLIANFLLLHLSEPNEYVMEIVN